MFRFPRPETAMCVIVDMQQKLLPAMDQSDSVLARTKLLVEGMNALNVPLVVTEQYPAGLGGTVEALASLFPESTAIVEKNSFSCFGAPDFAAALSLETRPTLIFAGVEAHVCVAQSALEALNRGFQVLLPCDAVSSRRRWEVENILETLRSAGCGIFSTESLLFMLMQSSKHPAFKTISKLVR